MKSSAWNLKLAWSAVASSAISDMAPKALTVTCNLIHDR
jgi:hypothetical protein